MKKNLSLLALLIILIGVTYVFQEKRTIDEAQETLASGQVIKEDITAITFRDVEAKKIDGKWRQGEFLLSHNSMAIIERKLREIQKLKDLDGEWKNYFPSALEFTVNGKAYAIGEMSLDKQGFYFSVDKKPMLAAVEGESTELTTDEESIPEIKLGELKRELVKTRAELKETQLFRFLPNVQFASVTVHAEGALPFELAFDKNATEPPPLPGVSAQPDLRKKFLSLLTQVTLTEELPAAKLSKFKKLSRISFGDTVVWELWLTRKDSADVVVIDATAARAFKIVGGTSKVFFIPLQDYWDKKIIPPQEFREFRSLPVTLIQGAKKATVEVQNKEPLEFKTSGFKVKPHNFQELIFLLFNLGENDQATRVSLLSKSERKQLLSEEHLRIDVLNQELLLWRKDQELIVVNLTQGFKAHFLLLEKTMTFRFQDMLE